MAAERDESESGSIREAELPPAPEKLARGNLPAVPVPPAAVPGRGGPGERPVPSGPPYWPPPPPPPPPQPPGQVVDRGDLPATPAPVLSPPRLTAGPTPAVMDAPPPGRMERSLPPRLADVNLPRPPSGAAPVAATLPDGTPSLAAAGGGAGGPGGGGGLAEIVGSLRELVRDGRQFLDELRRRPAGDRGGGLNLGDGGSMTTAATHRDPFERDYPGYPTVPPANEPNVRIRRG